MAFIPTYDTSQVQTTPVSTPQAQAAGPDTFGASLGKSLEVTSQALMAAKLHTDHAQAMNGVNDGLNRLQQLAKSTDVDPDTNQPMGYLNRQGPAADGIGQEFKADWEENVNDIRDGLQNDEQRTLFDRAMQKHVLAYDTAINEHEWKQKLDLSGATTKATMDQSLNSISQNYNIPELVSTHIDAGISAIQTNAALNGFKPDDPVVQNLVQQYESSAQKTVIDSYVKTGQATMAMKYFEEFDKGEPATDDEGKPIPGTEGSVFTKQDREQILSYLKPLSDAQRVASAADTYYQQGGDVIGALGKDKEAFPDDPVMQQEFRSAVLARSAQYQSAVGETVKSASNTVYQAMIANPDQTLDQLASDPKVTGAIQTMTQYGAQNLQAIKTALDTQATKAQGDTLIQAIDTKLNAMTAAGQHPGAAISSWPEFKSLDALDAERAKQLLEHEVGQQNVAASQRKSLALMDQQAQLLRQQQTQQANFTKIIANPQLLQTASPIGLRATGQIDAEQASMLDALQKKNDAQAKGQPVSWSQDQINRSVKGLLGYKGTLNPDQEQITESASSSLGMYLFRREQAASGPLNSIQVEQAVQDWAKTPAAITPFWGDTSKTVPMIEALKSPDRFLGTADAYSQVITVARKNGIKLTVDQARKAAAGVTAGGLK